MRFCIRFFIRFDTCIDSLLNTFLTNCRTNVPNTVLNTCFDTFLHMFPNNFPNTRTSSVRKLFVLQCCWFSRVAKGAATHSGVPRATAAGCLGKPRAPPRGASGAPGSRSTSARTARSGPRGTSGSAQRLQEKSRIYQVFNWMLVTLLREEERKVLRHPHDIRFQYIDLNCFRQ